jgi:hypothetical protein
VASGARSFCCCHRCCCDRREGAEEEEEEKEEESRWLGIEALSVVAHSFHGHKRAIGSGVAVGGASASASASGVAIVYRSMSEERSSKLQVLELNPSPKP